MSRSQLGIFYMQIIMSNNTRLTAELPEDGVKFISKTQSHCEKMDFADKRIYDRLFQQVQ